MTISFKKTWLLIAKLKQENKWLLVYKKPCLCVAVLQLRYLHVQGCILVWSIQKYVYSYNYYMFDSFQLRFKIRENCQRTHAKCRIWKKVLIKRSGAVKVVAQYIGDFFLFSFETCVVLSIKKKKFLRNKPFATFRYKTSS